MKKLLTYISVLFVLMLNIAFIPAASAVGVSPARGILKAAPGETIEGYVDAFNTMDVNLIAHGELGDFTVDENEELKMYSAVDPANPQSLMGWMELETNDIEMAPEEFARIKYKITVPEDAVSQSYYGSVFVAGMPIDAESDTESRGGAQIRTGVTHLVLLEVTGNLSSSLEVTDFALAQNEQGDVFFESAFFNEGNTHEAPNATIYLTDDEYEIIEELVINENANNDLPNRPKNFKTKWDVADYEDGIYYAFLDGEARDGGKLAAGMQLEISDGQVEMMSMELGKSLEQATSNNEADIAILIVFVLLAVALMLFIKYGVLNCSCRKHVIILFIMLAGVVIPQAVPNTRAADSDDLWVEMMVDQGVEEAIDFDGCWHDTAGTWSFDVTDTTANLTQPGDRETGAPTGDQYGWYDTAGDAANEDLLPLSGDSFGYDDCRIKITAKGWSNYEITVHGDVAGLDNGAGGEIPDMNGYSTSGFDFTLENENPSTPYPLTDAEHGFFIVNKSAGITAVLTDNGPSDIYSTGKAYDATNCGSRPCYHYIPDGAGNAVEIIDETVGDLEDETFVLRIGAGADFSLLADTYTATITVTLNTTP